MPESNRTLIEKADMAVANLIADGGYLRPDQAKKFIELAIAESVFVKECTNPTLASHTFDIPRILSGARFLRPGQEATALPEGDRYKPTTGNVTLNVKLFKGECRLTRELLEDSIEQSRLESTIMSLITTRVGSDVEDIALNGDTLSADTTLAVLDGIRKQATAHTYDHAGGVADRDLFYEMVKSMPVEHAPASQKMKFLVSRNTALEYDRSVSQRATDLGDRHFEGNATGLRFAGREVREVPLMPMNLSPGTYSNALLLDLKNVWIGWFRKIMFETDKDITSGEFITVAHMRMDVKLAVPDMVVKAVNIENA